MGRMGPIGRMGPMIGRRARDTGAHAATADYALAKGASIGPIRPIGPIPPPCYTTPAGVAALKYASMDTTSTFSVPCSVGRSICSPTFFPSSAWPMPLW